MIIKLNEIDGYWDDIDNISYLYPHRTNMYAGIVSEDINVYPELYYEGKKVSVMKAKELGLELPNTIYNYRKMLFLKDTYDTTTDLLYNSPNYRVNNNSIKVLHVNNVVYLGNLLKEAGFSDILSKSDIKKIYKMFLMKNNKFIQQDYLHLPISYEDFEKLKKISELSRIPTENVLNKFADDITFKPKIKIFTKK